MTSQLTCYYPDKSIATGTEPCNITLAGPDDAGSACCNTGDVCTTGGYCLGSLYYPYRGACTDKSWNSDNCASECLSAGTSKPVPAVPCGNSGEFNGEFCCSLSQNVSCCDATFGNVFGKPFAPVTLAVTTVNDTCGTNTTAVTTVTATPAVDSKSDATKVGVGVGVPLGLLLLLSLIFAAWTERRRRRVMERAARETGWTGGRWGHQTSRVHDMKGVAQEMDGEQRMIPELGNGEVRGDGAMF